MTWPLLHFPPCNIYLSFHPSIYLSITLLLRNIPSLILAVFQPLPNCTNINFHVSYPLDHFEAKEGLYKTIPTSYTYILLVLFWSRPQSFVHLVSDIMGYGRHTSFISRCQSQFRLLGAHESRGPSHRLTTCLYKMALSLDPTFIELTAHRVMYVVILFVLSSQSLVS